MVISSVEPSGWVFEHSSCKLPLPVGLTSISFFGAGEFMVKTHLSAVPYRDRLDELLVILDQHGSLGLLLIDLSQLSQVEHDYGSKAFEKVLAAASDLIVDLRGAEVRSTDIVATSDKGGDAFLVFLSQRRSKKTVRISELHVVANRVEDCLNQSLDKLASPYLRERLQVAVGSALVLHNPLVMPERLIARLIQEAWESVRLQRTQHRFKNRAQLQEILLNDEVRTFFQPIVDMRDASILGYEALTRGPEGSPLQSPLHLFEVAAEADLVFELDRLCRRRALVNSRGMPEAAKLFINILPSSMYDPDFHSEDLVKRLSGLGLNPEQMVFELTEKYAIENYSLFGEAVSNFTEMGFSIAVDDIGAGHSGLEKIAHLNPRYLKFDMELVREIHTSYVRREMVRALKILADRMGSTVIAEGIERPEEQNTLLELGIDYGQGFLLGRPAPLFGSSVDSISGPVVEPASVEVTAKHAPQRAN
jgi:EAL domain-containing protein (putative c-di-GMP-specific phosphodiesterase class I)